MDIKLMLLFCLQVPLMYTAPMQIQQTKHADAYTLSEKMPSMSEQTRSMRSLPEESLSRSLQNLVTMHTLQQPIPIETLRPLKTHYHQTSNNSPSNSFSLQVPTMDLQPPLMPAVELEQTMPFQTEGLPEELSQQILLLQQQMLALHRLQALKKLSASHAPIDIAPMQPVLIFLPEEKAGNTNQDNFFKNSNHEQINYNENEEKYHESEELDSIFVEAAHDVANKPEGYRKAILLVPNARISIGGIISTIPWLPIEINVPDTIAWAYNGIANGIGSIISIIGSRLPFRPRPETMPQENPAAQSNVKHFFKNWHGNNMFVEPVMPMPIPMPVFIAPVENVIPLYFNAA